jgi:hypothetical protein
MLRHDPESNAVILRATHIAHVTVEDIQFSGWTNVSGRIKQRGVRANVKLVEMYKGVVEQTPGAIVALRIVQSAPAINRWFAVPGAWSRHEIAAGAEFLIFSISGSNDAVEVLAEPSCFSVEPAPASLPDIRLALRSGTPAISLGMLVERCASESALWGHLFSQYLDARLPEVFYDRYQDFETFLSALEAPAISPVATRMLLPAAYAKLMLYDPAPPEFIGRLLLTTLRVLPGPHGSVLKDSVLGTYLPNLLGVRGGLERKEPSELFRASPVDRQRIEGFLTAFNAQPLLEWIRS